MNKKIITCAITGPGDFTKLNPHIPISPYDIAQECIKVAEAGASSVHIHVREKDGKGSWRKELYEEVINHIKKNGIDIVLNISTGMGGEFDVGMGNNPMDTGPENDMNYIYDRIAPAVDLLPEIASLDCGSLNFGDNNRVHVNTPHQLRLAAKKFREHNIKPILEVIELGHLWFVKKMIEEKIISDPPFIEICLGIPWGAPATLSTLNAFVDLLPENCVWSAYGTFDNQIKFIPEIIKKGGHIRVGLEDNLYLEDKTPAKNIDLVQKAVDIIKSNGFEVATPQDARNILNLKN